MVAKSFPHQMTEFDFGHTSGLLVLMLYYENIDNIKQTKNIDKSS